MCLRHSPLRTQGCGFCVTVHFIRGYHEIGTHKPKLSFIEIIRDANGPILGVDRKPIRKTHGHTWVVNYTTHTCKTSLATVIESLITGQMVIMNAKTLITEAGLEGKLNLATDQGSAWHQLETGFVNDHYYCTWHLVPL